MQEGFVGGWEWKRHGERIADIRLLMEEARLVLTYRFRQRGEDWQDICQPVKIEWTACRFGGHRPWFICPANVEGRPCRRRVVHLYGADRYFCCRHCYRLSYPSQSEKPFDRLARRSRKLRDKIGGYDFGVLDCPPLRPQGMHRRTYARHCEAIERVDRQIEQEFAMRFGYSMF